MIGHAIQKVPCTLHELSMVVTQPRVHAWVHNAAAGGCGHLCALVTSDVGRRHITNNLVISNAQVSVTHRLLCNAEISWPRLATQEPAGLPIHSAAPIKLQGRNVESRREGHENAVTCPHWCGRREIITALGDPHTPVSQYKENRNKKGPYCYG